MSTIKYFREIRLPAIPPKEIPHLIKKLADVLNDRQMNVRSFAIAENLSVSKVYNWFTGKAQPKQVSIDAIMRFFKKINFKYSPTMRVDSEEPVVQDGPDTYYVGKLLSTDKSLDSKDMLVIMKDIQISLKIHSEQSEFIKYHLLRLTEKVNFMAADMKAVHDYLAERHAQGDQKEVENLKRLFRKFAAQNFAG